MNPLRTRSLTRQQIGQFINSERGIRSMEDAQADVTEMYGVLDTAPFLTTADDTGLGSERALSPIAGELVGIDNGPGAGYTLGLADTAVTSAPYGAATKTVSFTVDVKGRLTVAAAFDLITDNVAEGVNNLYFTTPRARAAISAGDGVSYNSGSGVIALAASGVTAGTYSSPSSITVDQYGRITAIT